MTTTASPKSAASLRENDTDNGSAPGAGMKQVGGIANWVDERTGAAKGAAVGAGVGAIGGDAGKGAAAGAAVGGVAGRRGSKMNKQAAQAETANSYQRAYAACMEGRGYTVK